MKKLRRCEWCGRAWRFSIIPCSEASRAQLRQMGKTTLDPVCLSEIQARPDSYARQRSKRRDDELASGPQIAQNAVAKVPTVRRMRSGLLGSRLAESECADLKLARGSVRELLACRVSPGRSPRCS